MKPRVRWSLTWGIVGGLTVLVVGVGSRIVGVVSLPIPTIGVVALVVTAAVSALTYVLAFRLA